MHAAVLLFLYRVGPEWPQTAGQFAEALADEPFAPCAATQQKSAGWVPPRGDEHGALVELVETLGKPDSLSKAKDAIAKARGS